MSSHDALVFAAEGPDEGADAPPMQAWKIAVVDDDEAVRAITRLALGKLTVDGRPIALLEAASAEEGIALFATHPDIALGLIDMVMEDATAGLRLIAAVREAQGNQRTRLVVRTGQPGQIPEERIVRDYDINDFREKTELSAQKLRTLAQSAIRSYRDIANLEGAVHHIVDLLTRVLDERFARHLPHALGAAEIAAALATVAGLSATRAETLRHAAVLHDIGLLGLPPELRPALLDDALIEGPAREALRSHPLVGERLLERLATVEGRLAARLAREHHERWDGQGYPQGLRGEQCALESRILAVANVIDAMLSPGPGRGPHDAGAVRAMLAAQAGRELDPDIAALALVHFDALVEARADAYRPS